MEYPTQEEVKKILHYNPETGKFRWRVTKPGSAAKGSEAGYVNDGYGGYRKIKINDQSYGAHQLAWLYMTGTFPEKLVDHKNGTRDDNRWENLRLADDSENQALGNTKLNKTNTTGEKNIIELPDGKYLVKLVKNRKTYRKRFEKKEDAMAWRDRISDKLRGDFAKTKESDE